MPKKVGVDIGRSTSVVSEGLLQIAVADGTFCFGRCEGRVAPFDDRRLGSRIDNLVHDLNDRCGNIPPTESKTPSYYDKCFIGDFVGVDSLICRSPLSMAQRY